jgi:hypothetical protein
METHDPSAPDLQETFHIANISSSPGAGFTMDIWFEKGVGKLWPPLFHSR